MDMLQELSPGLRWCKDPGVQIGLERSVKVDEHGPLYDICSIVLGHEFEGDGEEIKSLHTLQAQDLRSNPISQAVLMMGSNAAA